MDLSSVRRIGKQPYETVREQFDQIGEHVIDRHWEPDAAVRQGYRKFLGALDELAGRLLDDDEIAQRGQDLLRETGATGADTAAGAGTAAGADGEPAADEAATWGQATAADDAAATGETAETAGAAGTPEAPGTAEAAGTATTASTVDVTFALPADVQAERVALCGEFNDWSPESITLTRGDDGSWRVTVPLAPGSYRYKYLLDGETWENAPDADRYEENAYGTVDSVVVVG